MFGPHDEQKTFIVICMYMCDNRMDPQFIARFGSCVILFGNTLKMKGIGLSNEFTTFATLQMHVHIY